MRNVANVLDASPDSKNETSTLFGSSNSFHPIIKSASDTLKPLLPPVKLSVTIPFA